MFNHEHRTNPAPEIFDGRCGRCYGLGAWLTPMGIVTECPKLQLRLNDHPQPSAAAAAILRAGRQLQFRKLVANDLSFRVARMLAGYGSTTRPVTRDEIADQHFEWARSTKKREIALVIEDLRSNWLLPVGSRKSQPFGYWIITDEADFRAWVTRSLAAPIRQISTIRAVARANFPVFAEQIELDFWKDLAPSEVAITESPGKLQ